MLSSFLFLLLLLFWYKVNNTINFILTSTFHWPTPKRHIFANFLLSTFQADGIEAQGGFQYTGDDGQVYAISYAAGQGGFQPQGAHIPTPPPVPEEILKALEQNARDEAAGIVDDGEFIL